MPLDVASGLRWHIRKNAPLTLISSATNRNKAEKKRRGVLAGKEPYRTCHGEGPNQCCIAFSAHAVDLLV